MKQTSRMLVGLLALTAVAAGGRTVDAGRAEAASKLFTLASWIHGNPEGVAYDSRSGAFFVGAIGDGTIYRGTLENPTISEFIPGGEGQQAGGMKVQDGLLYVAGGTTGLVSVYDIATRVRVALFGTGANGFLNDLVVTPNGDVYVTDTLRPILWKITAAEVGSGGGVPQPIPIGDEIVYEYYPSYFNLNGIVALSGGRQLIVVQSNTGKLFRIDLDESAPYGRTIHQIDVEPLWGGDGLLIDGGRLVVVQGALAPGMLTFVKLDGEATVGTVVERRTDPTFRGPSTVARAQNYYLVVNMDFATSTAPFTVTGIPR